MSFHDPGQWADPTDAAIEQAADRILALDGPAGRNEAEAIAPGLSAIAWIAAPDEIAEPKLAFLLEHWRTLARARGADMPDRRDIDGLNLVPALGSIMILEAEREGFDAIYRLYGTAIARHAGRDWTGWRVSAMNRTVRTPAALIYRSGYRAVFRRPAPLYAEHTSPPWVPVETWRRLVLPLADGEERCARYLVGMVTVGNRHQSDADLAAQRRHVRRDGDPGSR